MKRYCLALDLVEDAASIAEYQRFHESGNEWPEIRESILGSVVVNMEIYRTGNRLFMIMEINDWFSFEHKAELDAAKPARA